MTTLVPVSRKWYRSLFITTLNIATVAAWRICI
ncbi:hypothetical protein T08_13328 [Trichinella sp. T8]|nr:hypothetical protein T08_13328 [Trichinella sp. T8]